MIQRFDLIYNFVLRSHLLTFAAALALMGCGPDRVARPKGVLVAAIGSDPGHLNSAITTNGGVHTAADLLYDGLVELDASLRPVPGLAERWEVEESGALYRFHLRKDVRWHDGRPFTSADVKFTFEELLLRFHARTRASVGPSLHSIETPDAGTVVFRFKQPYAPFLQQVDVVEAPILPKHIYLGTDPLKNPRNLAPIGTGPFRFVSYAPDAEIRYRANRDYFGAKPGIDELVLRVIPDAGTQVLALEAGEVDWLFSVPGAQLARLRGNPRIRFLRNSLSPGGSNCVTTLAFNLDRPSWADARVRLAIAHAIDRQLFLTRALFGEGRVAETSISSGIKSAHAPDLRSPAFHPQEAARLLDEAGWKIEDGRTRVARGVTGVLEGERLTLAFKYFPNQTDYGNLLRAQLAAIGVEVKLEPLDAPVLVQAVFAQRDFDTALIPYCNGADPEIGVRRMFVSSSVAPIPFSNAAGYKNKEMDALFDRAARSIDPEERRVVYRRIQELALRDLPYIPLVETEGTRAYDQRCQGLNGTSHFAATARCDS